MPIPAIRHPLKFAALVAAAVLLFACTADREARGTPPADPPDAAESPRVKASPVAAVAPDPEPASSAWAIVEEAEDDGAEPDPDNGPARSAKPPRRNEPASGDGVRVFTNDDLRRYRPLVTRPSTGGEGGSDAPPEGGAAAGDADAEGTGKKGDAETSRERDERIASAQAEIARLEGEIEHLKSRIPSMRNPYLARVEPKERDKVVEDGMDNVERIEHVEERIRETQRLLEEERAKVAALQADGPG